MASEPSVSRSPLVLSIDVGSSSVRAAAHTAAGSPIPGSEAQIASSFDTTPDGGVQIDADALVDRLVQAIDVALQRLGPRSAAIQGVGASVFASSVLGVTAAGEPRTPVYTYADTRCADDAAVLRQEWDVAGSYDRTGTPIHASYLPARLRWLRRTQPHVVRQVARWITFAEYAWQRLFGRPCGLGLSLAAWSGMLNRRELDWDLATLGALNVDPTNLGAIDSAGEPLRGLAEPWRQRWPALADIPWFPALGDGLCSNLGTAPGESDAIVFNIGTSAAVRALVPGPVRSVPAGLWEYRVDRSRSLLGGAESNGGIVVAWLRDLLRGVRGDDPDDVIAHLPPDGHGLTVLPFLAGERSPGWDDSARATIHGARLNTRPADLLMAGIEAVSYRLAAIYDLLVPVIGEPHVVHVSGGALQRSDRWTQILADVLGRPVIRSAVAEPTSRGAAIWALQSLGHPFPANALNEGDQPFEPNLDHHAVYQGARARQRRLYQRMAGSGGLGAR
ncbi:MAG: gluconokinase [Chloroflexota bacterium]|nr:gluconokinase [Chloroflexota bacterium]